MSGCVGSDETNGEWLAVYDGASNAAAAKENAAQLCLSCGEGGVLRSPNRLGKDTQLLQGLDRNFPTTRFTRSACGVLNGLEQTK